MKRQRGRNRKPGGGPGSGGGGGGGGGGNNPNRAFESNGPEGLKTRGNAQHVYERYQQLARDAFTSGDRVLAENYLQHAEHYFRVLRTLQPSRPVSEIAARDAFASGFDIDFEDESGDQAMEGDQPMDNGDAETANRDNGAQNNGNQNNGNRDNGNRDDYRRDRDDRDYRNDNRDQQPRDNRDNRDFAENREPRPARDFGAGEPRAEGEGQAPRREGRRERFERRRNEDRGPRQDQDGVSDPLAVVEPRGAELPQSQPAPRVSVSEDDGSHLPAFLRQPSAPAANSAAGGDEAERPRRAPRRRRASEDGAPSVEAAEEDA